MNHTVNAETVISIIKAQRNVALDDAAILQARVIDLEAKNDALAKEIEELRKKAEGNGD